MEIVTNLVITIDGTDEELQSIAAVLTQTLKEEIEVSKKIIINGNYELPFEEQVIELGRKMAQVAGNATFKVNGSSESMNDGDMQDFRLTLGKNRRLRYACNEPYNYYEIYDEDSFDTPKKPPLNIVLFINY